MIQESAEEGMLTEYWQIKDELEEKYRKLMASLEVEEAAEIKMRTAKLVMREKMARAEEVMEVISEIREEYDITRSLLLKQKIQEVEDTIGQFQKRLVN